MAYHRTNTARVRVAFTQMTGEPLKKLSEAEALADEVRRMVSDRPSPLRGVPRAGVVLKPKKR